MSIDVLRAFSGDRSIQPVSRRDFLGGAGALAAASTLPLSLASGSARAATNLAEVRRQYPNYDWNDPTTNLRTLTRMYSSLEPGKTAWLYFFGRGVGTTGPEDYRPLFRMESVAVSQSVPESDTSIRVKAGQLILFCDWETNEVLDEWVNPYTNERCEVFHYRDYPLDYTMDFVKMAERYQDPTNPGARGLRVHWNFRKDMAYGDVFVRTNNKNKLDPKVWKRESIGEYWRTWEHYQWQAPIRDIVAPGNKQIMSFNGDIQTWKPWEPWMLMGQTPGKVIQQKTAMAIEGLDQIPRNVADYIEKNLAQYLDLENIPPNAYKLNDQHYKELRKPAE